MRQTCKCAAAIAATVLFVAAAVAQGPREDMPEPSPRPSFVPDTVEFVPDVIYANVKNAAGQPVELRMDTAFPRQSGDKPLPVVIYVHGGGYASGERAHGVPFTVSFAEGGYFAATISYRLTGQARYPAAVHDCKAAVRFLRTNALKLGINPDRIGIWGHSAGGHLSALLAVTGNTDALDGAAGDDVVSSAVRCAVSVSGPTDFTVEGNAWGRRLIEAWFGATGERYEEIAREASPLTWVDAADPPILLVHGRLDRLVALEHALLLRDRLDGVGVQVDLMTLDDAGHTISSPAAYRRVAEFFDGELGGRAAATSDNVQQYFR